MIRNEIYKFVSEGMHVYSYGFEMNLYSNGLKILYIHRVRWEGYAVNRANFE